jgi:hypothetical protein
VTSLTGRPVTQKTSKPVEEKEKRYAFVVCPNPYCTNGMVTMSLDDQGPDETDDCAVCAGRGWTKAELIRLAPGSKAKGDRIKIKRDVFDAASSDRVRARDNHTCTRCGKQPAKSGLHAMHFIGRGNDALFPGFEKHSKEGGCCLKHTDENQAAGCFPCHQFLDNHPREREAHFRDLFGDAVVDELLRLKRETKKRVKRKVSA